MAQDQHEHHVGHLPEGASSPQRRLGVRQRAGDAGLGLPVGRVHAARQDRPLHTATLQVERRRPAAQSGVRGQRDELVQLVAQGRAAARGLHGRQLRELARRRGLLQQD